MNWVASDTLIKQNGAWMPSGDPSVRHARDESRAPTVRLVRAAGLDCEVSRIGQLLREAIRIDATLNEGAPWSRSLLEDWRLTAPRSRRGRKREVDPNEVERRRGDGDDLYRIAADLGFSSRQVLSNARYRDRQRRLETPE
jgi:hypothetical protein